MAVSIVIPKLGVEMTSAKVSEWCAENGSQVEKGQVVAIIETDKLTNEVESPESGFFVTVGELGVEYDIGVEIARIVASMDEAQANGSTTETKEEPATNEEVKEQTETAAAEKPQVSVALVAADGWVKATPLARAIAKEKGINLCEVNGTGYGGSITRKDVESYTPAPKACEAAPKVEAISSSAAAVSAPPALPNKQVREEIKFTSTRAAIAKHMMQSLATTAQMTDIRHMEVSNFIEYRKELAAKEDVIGFKVSYFDLIIKMTANILKRYPEYNASVGDNSLIVWDNINIGIAVANDQGLIVPVLHDVDKMSLAEIHAKSQELIAKAREHRLDADDISGGTFTISNYGSFGSEAGTPVINMPQVAILGVGAMVPTPVVKDGQVVAGNVMITCLTQDHRVLDGENASKFQNLMKKYFEHPELILID